jgi:hypothetical protein
MASQIFISYSKKDKDFAWKLAETFSTLVSNCYQATCSQLPTAYENDRFVCRVQGIWNGLFGR